MISVVFFKKHPESIQIIHQNVMDFKPKKYLFFVAAFPSDIFNSHLSESTKVIIHQRIMYFQINKTPSFDLFDIST